MRARCRRTPLRRIASRARRASSLRARRACSASGRRWSDGAALRERGPDAPCPRRLVRLALTLPASRVAWAANRSRASWDSILPSGRGSRLREPGTNGSGGGSRRSFEWTDQQQRWRSGRDDWESDHQSEREQRDRSNDGGAPADDAGAHRGGPIRAGSHRHPHPHGERKEEKHHQDEQKDEDLAAHPGKSIHPRQPEWSIHGERSTCLTGSDGFIGKRAEQQASRSLVASGVLPVLA